MTALQAKGILHSGREGDVASWEVGGIKVALIAFAPFKGAHDLLNIPAAAGRIRALADSHEIVIVSMHAGGESGDVLRIPFETEYFRGENRGDVVRFARSAVDAGADLVVLIAGAGTSPGAAEVVARECFGRNVMCAGLVLAEGKSQAALDRVVNSIRPFTRVLVVAQDGDYIPAMLAALRA